MFRNANLYGAARLGAEEAIDIAEGEACIGQCTSRAFLVQLRNGERRSVIQGRGEESLNPGDAVILTTTGNRTRVSRAPIVVAPVKS